MTKDIESMTHRELKAEWTRLYKINHGENSWPDRQQWVMVNRNKTAAKKAIAWEIEFTEIKARWAREGGPRLETFSRLISQFM